MELWDIYDIHRNRIEGRRSVRGSEDMSDDEFHLVVFAAAVNNNGELLIGKRDRNKMFGGVWEFCGGSAVSGEDSKQAAMRELYEETGLDVSSCTAKCVKETVIKYWKGSNWFYDVWLFRCDFDIEKLTPQKGEVEELKKCSIDEVRGLLESNNFTGITAEYLDDIQENL